MAENTKEKLLIELSHGDVIIELHSDIAPLHVEQIKTRTKIIPNPFPLYNYCSHSIFFFTLKLSYLLPRSCFFIACRWYESKIHTATFVSTLSQVAFD